jgi:RHS repeat-associated protein
VTIRDSLRFTTGNLLDAAITEICDPQCANKKFTTTYDYNGTPTLLTNVVPSGPPGFTLAERLYSHSGTTGALDAITFSYSTTQFRYNSRLLSNVTKFPAAGDSVIRTFTSVAERSRIVAPPSYAATVSRDIELDTLMRVKAQWRTSNQGMRYFYHPAGWLDSIRFEVRPAPNCNPSVDFGYWTCGTPAWDSTQAFASDAVGNRTDHGGSYTTGNRVASFDGWSFQHDLDGNLTQKAKGADTVRYVWSANGMLRSVEINGQWHDLYYDAFGRLVAWNEEDGLGDMVPKRRFVWDRASLMVETNGAMTAGEGQYSYYPGALDRLHAYIDGSGTTPHFAHEDALGNVIATTNTSLGLVQTLGYDAWGKEQNPSQPSGYDQRARWKGALSFQSELGLVYMRARWYDPAVGRFLSEDPIGLEGGINEYVFGASDPINARDPTGLDCRMEPIWDWGPVSTTIRDGAVEVVSEWTIVGYREVCDPDPPPGQDPLRSGSADADPGGIGQQAEVRCAKAGIAFVFTAVADATGLRLVRLGLRATRAASFALNYAYIRSADGARLAAANAGYAALNYRLAGGVAYGQAAGGYITQQGATGVQSALDSDSDFHWSDVVPLVGSWNALRRWGDACFSPGAN